MSDLPGGTVTFVFTDIEGSTDLLKRLGDAYRDLLSQHRQVVRETFSQADGVEIDRQGDAFFFVFARARDAVRAAVEVQRLHATREWPEDVSVRLRIGLHTGEAVLHEEGYLGLDVVRAARICTVGRGGHILLSESTRALVGAALPAGVSVFPLGERHLRGIDEPERVYELEIEDLPVEEPTPEEAPAAPEPVTGAVEADQTRERDIDRRFANLGARLAEGIQERVLASLERTLGRVGRTDEETPSVDSSAVDDIAARAANLGDQISARVEEALRAKGLSLKDSE
jgi:class 3 adenylate cyclase